MTKIQKLEERVGRLASPKSSPEPAFSGESLAQDLKNDLEHLTGTPQVGSLLEPGDVDAIQAVILKAQTTQCRSSREFVVGLSEVERSALTNLICELERHAGG